MDFKEFFIPFLLTLIAGLSTVIGSLIFLSKTFSKPKNIGFFLGLSAGVMIYLSFIEMLPYSIKNIGFLNTSEFFFIGAVIMMIIDFLLPHHYSKEKTHLKRSFINPRLYSTGILVTVGLAIHNIPEGMAVFISSFSNIHFGILLTIAIAIHNIPEGISVAAPIYYATLNKWKAIKYALIAGMAEPFGAIIAYLLFKPYLNQNTLSYIFAVVAGIMAYISISELLPACFRDKYRYNTVLGITAGAVLAYLSLSFLYF